MLAQCSQGLLRSGVGDARRKICYEDGMSIQITEIIEDRSTATPAATRAEFLISPGDPFGSLMITPSKAEQIAESHPCLMGNIGGTTIPDWHDTAFRQIYRGATEAFRMLNARFAPRFGVVIDSRARAPKIPATESLFAHPKLSGLPNVSPSKTLADPIFITMPWGALHNYGHFVLDCLTGVEAAIRLDDTRRRFVFPPLKGWQRDHLRLMDVEWEELSEDWYHASDVIYTSCMSEFLHSPNELYQQVAERQLAKLPPIDVSSRIKIYISRRGLEKRSCPDEPKLEDQLSDHGFTIIIPEEMPVVDQITLFNRAAVIVGLSGAGFANAIYCRPHTKIIEIQPELARGIWVRNICAMAGLEWSPYFCESEPAKVAIKIGGIERPEVGITTRFDVDDLLTFILAAEMMTMTTDRALNEIKQGFVFRDMLGGWKRHAEGSPIIPDEVARALVLSGAAKIKSLDDAQQVLVDAAADTPQLDALNCA